MNTSMPNLQFLLIIKPQLNYMLLVLTKSWKNTVYQMSSTGRELCINSFMQIFREYGKIALQDMNKRNRYVLCFVYKSKLYFSCIIQLYMPFTIKFTEQMTKRNGYIHRRSIIMSNNRFNEEKFEHLFNISQPFVPKCSCKTKECVLNFLFLLNPNG